MVRTQNSLIHGTTVPKEETKGRTMKFRIGTVGLAATKCEQLLRAPSTGRPPNRHAVGSQEGV